MPTHEALARHTGEVFAVILAEELTPLVGAATRSGMRSAPTGTSSPVRPGGKPLLIP
ncbi:hypothetical protein [Actinacidiphila sp. bgisy160]|uniref:hypothetical protein n=1 Tax=Actinacidiphila sp. bgisy160 TaxID=3413796 RepID=UPI003D70C94B